MAIIYSKVTTQPTGEPVSINEAKAHLRITFDYDDTYISGLITAARQRCELYSQLSFFTQTRTIKLDAFPSDDASPIILPYGPVASVTSINYIDTDGDSTLWASTEYAVDTSSDLCRVYPIDDYSYPDTDDTNNTVTIVYVAGQAVASIPQIIKHAVLMECANLYENRGDAQMSASAAALLDQVKVYYYAGQEE